MRCDPECFGAECSDTRIAIVTVEDECDATVFELPRDLSDAEFDALERALRSSGLPVPTPTPLVPTRLRELIRGGALQLYRDPSNRFVSSA